MFASGSEPVRIIYIGSGVSNLHQLVVNEQPSNRRNVYPYPQIHPLLPWAPDAAQIGIPKEVAQDLRSFPTKEVRDALVDSYFSHIHPGFPIVDEKAFRRQYNDRKDPPALILFHAVLLAGAHVCNHPTIAASRSVAVATLFRRTKSLFDLRYENDRLHLVQAALLMAWHLESSDNISSNTYYWVGQACRMVFGLGMHRDLTEQAEKLMPAWDRKTYRVTWWMTVQAEVFSAMEHGRPCMINRDDFDQPPLCDNDFTDDDSTPIANVEKEVCYINGELCELALDVLKAQSPGGRRNGSLLHSEVFNSRLASIALKVASSAHGFWRHQLRINYNTIQLLVYRDIACMHPRLASGLAEEAATLSSEAASAILTSFEGILASKDIPRCQPNSNMALMATTIQLSQEIKNEVSKGSMLRALNAQNQLERCLVVAKEFAAFWPYAKPTLQLCQSLVDRYSAAMKATAIRENVPVEFDLDSLDIPWHDLMPDYQHEHFDPIEQDEWMNASHYSTCKLFPREGIEQTVYIAQCFSGPTVE